MQLTVYLLGIFVVTVACHEFHSLHGHRSSGGDDWHSSVSPSIAAVRSSSGTLGRANNGWGRSSGYGSNAPSSYSSNGHSNSFSERSHYASDSYPYGNYDRSFQSGW